MNIADVNDLHYAATALAASDDAGDRYCAQRLRNLALAITIEQAEQDTAAGPRFSVGSRVVDLDGDVGTVRGISKDGGLYCVVHWDDHMNPTRVPTDELSDLCAYRTVWTDEVGDIPVCILHGQNSRHVGPPTSLNPHRPCLALDPYPETPAL